MISRLLPQVRLWIDHLANDWFLTFGMRNSVERRRPNGRRAPNPGIFRGAAAHQLSSH
jgi:hypothetical protein